MFITAPAKRKQLALGDAAASCITTGCPAGQQCVDDGTGTGNAACYGTTVESLPVSSIPPVLQESGVPLPPAAPCLQPGAVGPLSPGQVYCDTGTTIASGSDAVAQAATNAQASNYMPLLIGAGVALLAVVLLGGRR